MNDDGRPWAIVLAGGDGVRLQSLTQKIDGDPRPKQFSKIFGGRTLLGHTRERLRPIFTDKRLMFVVNKHHDRFFNEELADVTRSRVLQQPANRGTGIAIIVSLLQILKVERNAMVGIFPSDHYYADDAAFAMTARSAIELSHEHHDSIVLIGAKPECPEIEYGWIQPGPSISSNSIARVFSVKSFFEKPPLREARKLMANGGLWNTFVAIGRAGAFLNLLAATQLSAMTRIEHALTHGDLGGVYGGIELIDFSRDVLSREPRRLLVIEDAASGWADLGHPNRVISTLDRHRIEPQWLSEMRGAEPQSNRKHVCAFA